MAEMTKRLYPGKLGRVNHEPTVWFMPHAIGIGRRLLRLLTKVRWEGTENIPQSGPAILVANHISSLDPVLIGEFLIMNGRWPHFLARANLFDSKLLGYLLRKSGQIPVYRGTDKAADSLVAAHETLECGGVVIIYPEGTITFDPLEWPMVAFTGAGRLAVKTGAPVIPVGQWGANYALPPRKIRPFKWRRHKIRIVAGPPVDLSELDSTSSKEAGRQATLRIMDQVRRLTEIARGQNAPDDVWHPVLKQRVSRDNALR